MSAFDEKGSGPPLPTTGRAQPLYDGPRTTAAVTTKQAFRGIYIEHDPHRAIIERIEGLRLSSLGIRGEPLDGLRLSQFSQAGKSKTLKRYMAELAERMAVEGHAPNEYQVIYIELRTGITLKMLCQQVLRRLGDPHWKQGSTEEVRVRMEEFILHRGVELIIVDEVQWLARERNDCALVTDQLKNLLNAGYVPLVLAGNEESRPFFELNPQLAARLSAPLELSPLSTKDASQATLFKTFCSRLDRALVSSNAVPSPSGLSQGDMLQGLLKASGGHVGRVCRIIEAALEHSTRREATRIERYDLAIIVRDFAMPQGYVDTNPFGDPA